MPTRKEILEALAENLDGLSDEIGDSAGRYRDAADSFSEGANQFSDSADRMADATGRLAQQVEHTFNGVSVSLETAADRHGKSIEKAGGDILAGLVGGAALLVGGLAIGGLVKIAMERASSVRRKTQIIKSIIDLHEKHGPMEYDFVVKRTFADDTTNEQRQTILNGLINDRIVEEVCGDNNLLTIDPNSKALNDYWTWLEDTEDELKKIAKM